MRGDLEELKQHELLSSHEPRSSYIHAPTAPPKTNISSKVNTCLYITTYNFLLYSFEFCSATKCRIHVTNHQKHGCCLTDKQHSLPGCYVTWISLNNQKINYRMSIPSKSARTEIDFPPPLAALFTVARTDTTHANSTSILKSPFNLTRQNVQAVYQAREGKAKEDPD